MDNTQPILQLHELTKSYGDNQALAGIDLSIQCDEFITILGPSGCGKTTLLKLIAGFETPSSGEIYFQGAAISQLPPQKRPVHTVFQNYALFPHMTVFENIAFPLRVKQNLNEAEISERVMAILAMVKLPDYQARMPRALSGGQQQRVAIARALVDKPALLLLDECLSALDYHLRKAMQFELKTLQRELGIPFIFVTHSQEESLSMSDRVVILSEGKVAQVGSPREVYEEPNSLSVATFIGEANVFSTTVDSVTERQFNCVISNKHFRFDNDQNFVVGELVHIVVRPEDIYVNHKGSGVSHENALKAVCEEVIYKGSTVDLKLKLESGKIIYASEFFNEDDRELNYRLGEMVDFHWLSGWEVVLQQ